MAVEQTSLSDLERRVIQQVADQRGISIEEAIEQMAKEGLAARVKKRTGKNPARVYQMPGKRP